MVQLDIILNYVHIHLNASSSIAFNQIAHSDKNQT